MASVAAATSSSRRHRHELAVLAQSLQRAKDAEEQRKYRKRATQIIKGLSEDGQWLRKSLFEKFLTKTLRTAELNPDALKMAKKAAKKRATNTSSENGAAYSKEALLDSVDKYREYVSKRAWVEQTFQKYDKGGHGYLTRWELARVLQDQERKAHRAAKGIAITLVVSPKDMNQIMRHHASGNDRIRRSDLLPAIEMWEALAKDKIERKQMAFFGGCIKNTFHLFNRHK